MKPFKVVCIQDNWKNNIVGPNNPKVGDIDDVVDTYEYMGRLIYILKGRSNPDGYLALCFAPVQTNYADATAEILEKFKQTDEQPDKIIIPEKELTQP